MSEYTKFKLLDWFVSIMLILQLILSYISLCHVRDYGRGIDEVNHKLESVTEQQREVTTGLNSAQGTAKDLSGAIDSSKGAVNQATATTGRLDGEIRTSGEIIRECQSILGAVEARGTKEGK